jgi:branched-chain amino acid transport system substrate-binding protein
MSRYLKLIFLVILSIIFFEEISLSQTLRIGVAGPHSGSLSDWGIPTLRAVEIVAAEYNANGGINGDTIEIILGDDSCNPSQASLIANSFISDRVQFVIGHICSTATKTALNLYKPNNIITISPSSTNPELTYSGDYPNFFRTIPPGDVQAKILIKYILDVLKLKRIALVHDGGPYKGLVDVALMYIEQSKKSYVVLHTSITPGLNDYSLVAQDIANFDADVLVYGGFEPEASKILNEIRSQNLNTVFFSGDAIKGEQFIINTGENAEGAYATSTPDLSNEIIAQKARDAHLIEYGEEPGPYYYNAYSAAICLFEAIDLTNSTDFDTVRDSLISDNFYTPFGRTQFDEKGDVIGLGYSIYQVQGGAFVEVFGNFSETQLNDKLIGDITNNLNLPDKIVNSYLANLKKVNRFIEDGKINPAINQLFTFTCKVKEDMEDGALDSIIGADLLVQAETIIFDLGGDPNIKVCE